MSDSKGSTVFMRSYQGGIAALLLLPVFSGVTLAQVNEANIAAPVRAQTVQHSVKAGVETGLSIKTTPGASCIFRAEAESSSNHPLRLDADNEGVVRIHAHAKSPSVVPVPMLLECTAQSGQRTTYPIEIRAEQANRESAAPESRARVESSSSPALAAVAESMTNAELVAHGYPPRPDQRQAPGAYAKWRNVVSRQFTPVDQKRVAHPEMKHSPTLPVPPPSSQFSNSLYFTNWSGAYMTNPDVQYWEVQADWILPAVSDVPASLGYAAAAVWVGLDNASNDLVQSGTDSESTHVSFFGIDWTFTKYSVWIESLPYSPYYLPNFPASPGDEISVSIFLADQNGSTTFNGGALTPSDDTVWFMIYNLTTGSSYWGTLPKPAAFSGSTVDFIVEAPNVNGATAKLANFGVAGMHDCYFADSWFGYSSLDYNGSDPNVGSLNDITMFNYGNGDTLASSYIYANYSAPAGGNILWVWQNYF